MFNRTFWRLLVGFVAVLIISFLIFLIIGYIDGKSVNVKTLISFFKG
ncbi:MAG: hypothetical protein WCW14_02140 [Candidatus Paceibacterota bacterium]